MFWEQEVDEFKAQAWQEPGGFVVVRVSHISGEAVEASFKPEYPTMFGLDVVDTAKSREMAEELTQHLEEELAKQEK